ncbi:hypothetical protein K504DRAFT_204659 [Pleomassaria siparia CBS 279.74]|uniref:Uncharacterized protein n=1 Tax=Pleomassaria siparia CBS 279.74 TaxID=1314801 RepID=A0A6G1KJB8_9PLEO|nr:hypothetical protein K504DRAFT_204659 [Pleomassaria siparia CBS 279.74]
MEAEAQFHNYFACLVFTSIYTISFLHLPCAICYVCSFLQGFLCNISSHTHTHTHT